MYRVTSHILSNRSMLYCRPSAEFQLKSVSRGSPLLKYKKATERETCPKPPPLPPPPPKDDKLLWGALSVLVLAGGFAFYAKQSPELRDWLTLHAPWFDDFIAIAYQENMTYKEFAEKCVDDMKRYLDGSKKPKQCSLGGDSKPIQAAPPSAAKESKDKSPPPATTKSICDIEECVWNVGEDVINNYITAKDACAYYNKLVQDTMLDFSMTKLKDLHDAKAERLDLVRQSLDNINTASAEMDNMFRYVECGGVQAPKEQLETVKGIVKDFKVKISALRMQYLWENNISTALDNQVLKVEKSVTRYTDENQTLFPGLRYDQKRPFQGDPDLLLFQNYRYANKLQDDVSEASSAMSERVNRALENIPPSTNRSLAISMEYTKRKLELEKDFMRRADEQKANHERILNAALKTQMDRHEEALEQKLLQKEKEIVANRDRMIADKVAEETKDLSTQLAEIIAKIKSLEDNMGDRMKAEKQARRSQQLWSAGAALLSATRKADPVIEVDKEIKAIEKASGDDKLVKTVLKAIPSSVRTNGIVAENILRERYHRMEKAALRVALVEQDGGPLPIFALSWLQSMMLFMKLSCIPQAEVDKMPQEPFKGLDTFDLLRRARYWIDRGNLAAAVRYVNSLEGASRLAAATWFEAARAHLETKQAAEAVVAHAAALGLQYL